MAVAKKGRRSPKQKATEAAAQAPVPTQPGRNGGRLRVGNPGNKGGGRPSNEWRNLMSEFSSDPRALASLRRSLRGKNGPLAQIRAYKYVSEQAHGKATQPVAVAGELTSELTVRVVHE